MNWKDELKEMKFKYMEQNTPNAFAASGGRSMKIKPYNDTTANGLTNCIIDWINLKGGSANRINTQGQVRKEKIQLAFGNVRELTRFTPSTTRKGTADIHAVMRGYHISIEVKVGNDKMSLAQISERARIQNAGGIYYTAKSMQAFVDWFKEIF